MNWRKNLMALAACTAAMASAPLPVLAQGQPLIFPGPCAQFGYLPACARKGGVLITYVNGCMARNAGARMVSDGACPTACPMVYQPVCATTGDGKRTTFGNACQAKAAGAQITRNGRCLPRLR